MGVYDLRLKREYFPKEHYIDLCNKDTVFSVS
jgi:hypothetical protein